MPALLLILTTLLCVCIAVSDLRAHRVPNTWLLSALLAGTVLLGLLWVTGEIAPPWQSLLGLTIGLTSLLPFYAIHWMGAGDVKFFAVLGFLLGAKALLPIWIIGSMLAGMHAMSVLLHRWRMRRVAPAGDPGKARGVFDVPGTKRGTPYAACLAAGALAVLFDPQLARW